jgi:hypothetical protein
MSEKTQPGILINLSPEDSAQLIEWVQEIDWRIIKRQIERGGKPTVLYKAPGETFSRFVHLEEISKERGIYRPHYGDTGGGFEYKFRATPGCTKVSGYSHGARFYKVEAPPLEITLPQTIETEIPEELQKNFGLLYPHDNHFAIGENQFGFHGEFFSCFHNWQWYSEDTEAFEFSFVPMSIGCLVRISHIESNEMLDLTRDADW